MAAEEQAPQEQEVQGLDDSQDNSVERERSTIKFPYGDLDSAVEIAKSIHAVGGTSCEIAQISAHLGLKSSTSGAFKQKLLTAKTFGLVEYSGETIKLTSLGSDVCDPKKEKKAKADAFLKVPLYKAVYEKFKGGVVPGITGLESEMAGMGVAKKQTDKARQCLQRSAIQAGFTWSGPDRLVMPKGLHDSSSSTDDQANDDNEERDTRNRQNGGGGNDGESLHPFIQGLLKELPKATETEWPIAKRAQWLQIAAGVFNMIYTDEKSTGVIEVKIQGRES